LTSRLTISGAPIDDLILAFCARPVSGRVTKWLSSSAQNFLMMQTELGFSSATGQACILKTHYALFYGNCKHMNGWAYDLGMLGLHDFFVFVYRHNFSDL